MPPPQNPPQSAGAAASSEQRIIDLQNPAAILTLYVGVRANQLGIPPDAALADPRWTTLCTEAMQLVNSWMSWDATLAIAAWLAAGYGKSTVQPASPAPAGQPPVTTTTPAKSPAPSAAPAIANPVAAAMTALGLRAAS